MFSKVAVIILLVAFGLRVYQVQVNPPSLSWDEVSIGYNAYSILRTGKDEHGRFLPYDAFVAYGDYKPPLAIYLTVPFVALFGLNELAVRFPSALFGTLTVLWTFFLVRELLKQEGQRTINSKRDNRLLFTDYCPALSAALLAISPWHIQFSRVAFEANSGVTVNIWAVVAFLVGLRKRIFLPVSAALFALGMYAYHSERIFLPLLVVLLLVVYRKQLFTRENGRYLVGSGIVGFVVVLPLLPVMFDKTAILRLRGTSSFTDQTNLLSRNIKKIEEDRTRGDKIGELLDNRRIVWAKTVLSGYLSHFSFRWLFFTGDNPRHHAPDMGLLYFFELPFLLIGVVEICKRRGDPARAVLLGWFLLSPVAASPTTGLPHAIRTLVFLPTFQIFTAVGIVATILNVKYLISNRKDKFTVYCLLSTVVCYVLFATFNIVYYLDMYFVHMNPETSEYWQYGYADAVRFAQGVKGKYAKVVVSTTLEQSYMFFLFYTQYDPKKYLAAGGTKSGSFEEGNNAFDAYEFRKINWSQELRDGSILYIGTLTDMPHGNVMNITFLNGKSAIEMADQPNGAP